jgi:dihydrofolate reductase
VSKPLVVQVFAVADNGVIGRNGDLPWHVPTDLAFFKRVTLYKPMIMGRLTYESLPGMLPNRPCIVVTRRPLSGAPPEVEVAVSLEEGLRAAEKYLSPEQREIVIAGGAQIYRAAMPYTDRLIVTHIAAEPEGDTVLDCVNWADWQAVSTECPPQSEKDEYACRFVVYERKTQS